MPPDDLPVGKLISMFEKEMYARVSAAKVKI